MTATATVTPLRDPRLVEMLLALAGSDEHVEKLEYITGALAEAERVRTGQAEWSTIWPAARRSQIESFEADARMNAALLAEELLREVTA